MKKVTKAIKALNSLNEDERLELEEYLKNEEEDEAKVEVKEEPKKVVEEIKKEEVKKDFVTKDELTGMIEQLLQKVALKDEVEEIKVDKKKAQAFGIDGKVVVQEGNDRDNRLAKILADFN